MGINIVQNSEKGDLKKKKNEYLCLLFWYSKLNPFPACWLVVN